MSTVDSEPDNSDGEREAKRVKLDDADSSVKSPASAGQHLKLAEPEDSYLSTLPPSRVLLGVPSSPKKIATHHFEEFDVGISEYISKDLPPVHAIIKQRFTDFLVHEVNLDGDVVHIKSLAMPSSEPNKRTVEENSSQDGEGAMAPTVPASRPVDEKPSLELAVKEDETVWSERFNETLKEFLSEPLLAQLNQMYLEGPVPPLVSDNGWAGRQAKVDTDEELKQEEASTEDSNDTKGKRGKRDRDRGSRGRGRGRGGRGAIGTRREDTRKVLSDPIDSKDSRTRFHNAIRELFRGKLETETDSKSNNEGGDNRIVIKWSKGGRGRDGGSSGGGGRRGDRDNFPPYIHFTLQKTNRDTQDAIGHLSRMLKVNVKDLSVSGTKDKRGVTVQRVSLKRNGKKVEDIWKSINNVPGRRSAEEAMKQRGERGVRVSDLNYRKASLELGMLKGNVFEITLRNVQVEPMDVLDKAMDSLKNKGFINYYGMQRFGTASVPTHAIGLAILKSDWHKAVELILQLRPGEHPEVAVARDAWLIEGDLEKALELMPRRVVAERCILESYKKQNGDTRNAMGSLSTVPRNLRLMYVHAYQSYVWNAIVSERIRSFGSEKPVPGDIVFDSATAQVKSDGPSPNIDTEMLDETLPEEAGGTTSLSGKRTRKPWEAPKITILTEADVDKYTIFDVIMPLPGKDVAYPGGALGERYRNFLELDGLDPDDWGRKQKEYSLSGSYRKILHKPKDLTWSILRYTDPDVSLAQSDEDKLLGFEQPVIDENGKFVALQVKLELPTAAYATMALREITKAETGAHHQTNLTRISEDQLFRGTAGGASDEMEM